MRKIGIIGHGKDKFTEKSEQEAKIIISQLIKHYAYLYSDLIVISGRSPVGGIDIWAETYAKNTAVHTDIKVPKQHTWNSEYGYKQRNLDIAKDSDEVHIILVDRYPENYKGMKFKQCYHCKTNKHIKSGACWTGIQALKLGKKVFWHIIKND
jgi:hypothetical protein